MLSSIHDSLKLMIESVGREEIMQCCAVNGDEGYLKQFMNRRLAAGWWDGERKTGTQCSADLLPFSIEDSQK